MKWKIEVTPSGNGWKIRTQHKGGIIPLVLEHTIAEALQKLAKRITAART